MNNDNEYLKKLKNARDELEIVRNTKCTCTNLMLRGFQRCICKREKEKITEENFWNLINKLQDE